MDISIEFRYNRTEPSLYRLFERTKHNNHGFITITVWRFQVELYWDKE